MAPIRITQRDIDAADQAVCCTAQGWIGGRQVFGEVRLELEKLAAFSRLRTTRRGQRTLLSDPDWIKYLGIPPKAAERLLARVNRGESCLL